MGLPDLTSHVYGPYPDSSVLKDTFPRPKSGIKVPLRQLEIYCEDKQIGFDESEYIISPPSSSRVSESNVTFYGVLEIKDLDWLSEKGRQYLEKDFRERDEAIHIEHLRPTFSLETLYSLKKHLKIRIGCQKKLLAHYLTTDNDPDRLLIYSQTENIKRTFWVQSLHPITYRKSVNFIMRYRLRALIVELVELDPRHTPLPERNVEWIVQTYLEQILPRDKDSEKRLIKDPKDEINMEPRYARHIHRSQLLSELAAQAEWMLANQIASTGGGPNTRLVDIRQWIEWCKKSRHESITANENRVQWGRSDFSDIKKHAKYNLAANLAKFGKDTEFWARQLKNAINRAQQSTAKRKKRKQSSPELDSVSHPVAPPVRAVFQYDSDFSEGASSSEASDFRDESEPPLNLKEFSFCFQPPQISVGRFTWHCLGPGCPYTINLLDISPDNLALLPDETIRVLHGKSWRVQDKPVQKALAMMVSKHYEKDHLKARNIHLVPTGTGTYRAELIRGAKRTGPPTQVKQEEQSQPLRQSSRILQRPRRFH